MQYGALLNQNFRFYDKRMGQSVTASGRCILGHQIRKGCEIIDGDYNIDPIVDDEDPRALRGEIASPCLLAGDTDSVIGSTAIRTLIGDRTIENLFNACSRFYTSGVKEFAIPSDLVVGTFDSNLQQAVYKQVEFIYRHKVSKERWKITDQLGNVVVTTGDHSIMVERDGVLIEVKPRDMLLTDILITNHSKCI